MADQTTEYVVATDSFRIENRLFTRGEVLSEEDLPAKRLLNLMRVGWVAPAGAADPNDVAIGAASQAAQQAATRQKMEAGEELDPSLEKLGLSKAITAKLTQAGLTTRAAVAQFAVDNQGLSKAGLGPNQQQTVFAALEATEPAADAETTEAGKDEETTETETTEAE